MSQTDQPNIHVVCRGIRLRVGQASRWADRIKDRLDRAGKSRLHRNQQVVRVLRDVVDKKTGLLKDLAADTRRWTEHLRNSSSASALFSRSPKLIGLEFIDAIKSLEEISKYYLPVISSRDETDLLYDALVRKLASEHRLSIPHRIQGREEGGTPLDPLTSQMQWDVWPVSVFSSNVDAFARFPIISSSCSTRSLLTLALTYHEFGHVIDKWVIGEDETDRILDRLTIVKGSWRREVAADMIGGILGGYSFLSSFCAFAQPEPKQAFDDRYPTLAIRAWLINIAAGVGGAREEDLVSNTEDPIYVAWNALVEGRTPNENEIANAKRASEEIKRKLVGANMVTCGQIDPKYAKGRPRLKRGAEVSEVLLGACKYRSLSRRYRDYLDWERGYAPVIGLPTRRRRSLSSWWLRLRR